MNARDRAPGCSGDIGQDEKTLSRTDTGRLHDSAPVPWGCEQDIDQTRTANCLGGVGEQ